MPLTHDRYPIRAPAAAGTRLRQTARCERPSGDGGRTRRRLRAPHSDDRGGDLVGNGGAADAAGQQNLGELPVDLFDVRRLQRVVGWCWTGLYGSFYLALCSSIRLGMAGRLWPLAAR